ncbi:MAG: prolipoprotein diacylglyceryl transferase [Acidobacteria bacterium]|nr:prolipoprotein diacylglyceryl transferase [Acidobacteriota bacterium]
MLPEIFRVGSFALPTYGLLVATAFLVALALTGRLAREAGMDRETVVNLGIYCVLAGIVGAKLLMLLLDLPFYWSNPGEIFSFATLQAGGVFYGGLLAALATAWWFMRRKGLPFLATGDVFAPGVAIGHAIGRIGCFAAGCCWGVECRRSWAVTFSNPVAHENVGVPLNIPLHPTQLYEAAAEMVIFAILYRRFHQPHRRGAILGLYLALYSAARFVIEFFRVHEQPNPFGGPLNTSQWIALALIAAVAGWALAARRPDPINL